jgi:histidinol-phosphatase
MPVGMNEDIAFALRLADVADGISLAHFRSAELWVEAKEDRTPVSLADRAVEEALRAELARERDGDAVLGEELGAGGEGPRRWILDPIDATRNYVRGIPIFATLIALEEEDELTAAVVSAPALGRRWWAARGEGAFADGVPIRVSAVERLEDAALSFGGGAELIEQGGALAALARRSEHVRGFGDFWQHMLVAEGCIDIAVDPIATPWDLAAPKLIVEEARGRLTDLAGVSRADGGSGVSSNGLLHSELLAALEVVAAR